MIRILEDFVISVFLFSQTMHGSQTKASTKYALHVNPKIEQTNTRDKNLYKPDYCNELSINEQK